MKVRFQFLMDGGFEIIEIRVPSVISIAGGFWIDRNLNYMSDDEGAKYWIPSSRICFAMKD